MTEKLELTIERARELLVEAVEEKGADYIYPLWDSPNIECLYGNYADPQNISYNDSFEEQGCDGPGCIVGHVLVKAGVSQETLYQNEGTGAVSLVAKLQGSDQFRGTPLSNALSAAQSKQDNGSTWGEALEAFDLYLKDNEAKSL